MTNTYVVPEPSCSAPNGRHRWTRVIDPYPSEKKYDPEFCTRCDITRYTIQPATIDGSRSRYAYRIPAIPTGKMTEQMTEPLDTGDPGLTHEPLTHLDADYTLDQLLHRHPEIKHRPSHHEPLPPLPESSYPPNATPLDTEYEIMEPPNGAKWVSTTDDPPPGQNTGTREARAMARASRVRTGMDGVNYLKGWAEWLIELGYPFEQGFVEPPPVWVRWAVAACYWEREKERGGLELSVVGWFELITEEDDYL